MGIIDATRFRQHREGVVGKRFPFEDACAEAVFASHLLEHLPLDVAANCFREIYRVLKPGGVVRLGVPDLDLLVRRFASHAPDEFVVQIFESQHSRDKNRHHWVYNETSLAAALPRRRGRRARAPRVRSRAMPDIALLDNRPDITLFMENAGSIRPATRRCGEAGSDHVVEGCTAAAFVNEPTSKVVLASSRQGRGGASSRQA